MVKPARLLADIVLFLAIVAASVSFIRLPPLNASGTDALVAFSGAVGVHDAELTWTVIFFIVHCLIALCVLFAGKWIYRRMVNTRR